MRTKTLLLTAALSAAGIAASMAQVYSVNVVGYVNNTVPAGKWAILANPLDNGANVFETVMQLPLEAQYQDSTIYRYDGQNSRYLDSLTFYSDYGWYDTTGIKPLNPGEGFWVKAPPTAALNFTFVGEVKQGTMSMPLTGGSKFNLIGTQVPQSIAIGYKTNAIVQLPYVANTMEFPAADGDTLYIYDTVGQKYNDSYTFYKDFGWYAASDETHPEGPVIAPGNGFWVYKTDAGTINWTRTYNVQ